MSGARPSARDPVPIGPGRLVAVVGPSGAGKDTLIAAAREALAGDDHYVFPRRMITRPPSASEGNAEISRAAFESVRAGGGFALAWTAHRLGYGVPIYVDDEIRRGRTVICNLSRTVLPELRSRYASPLVIEITAPPEILARRLAHRGRAEDGDLRGRVARSAALPPIAADTVVVNDGDLAAATRLFLAAIV